MGVNNPCDSHGPVMSRVTPLYVTKVETLKFHEFLMVSLHFFGTIDIMYYVAIN